MPTTTRRRISETGASTSRAGTDFPLEAGETLVFKVDDTFPARRASHAGLLEELELLHRRRPVRQRHRQGRRRGGLLDARERRTTGFLIGDMIWTAWNNDSYLFQNALLNNDCVEPFDPRQERREDPEEEGERRRLRVGHGPLRGEAEPRSRGRDLHGRQNAVNSGGAPRPDQLHRTGDYLGSKVTGAKAAQRAQALALATTLDQYNNGNIC